LDWIKDNLSSTIEEIVKGRKLSRGREGSHPFRELLLSLTRWEVAIIQEKKDPFYPV